MEMIGISTQSLATRWNNITTNFPAFVMTSNMIFKSKTAIQFGQF